jgi:hypothetical protein
MDRGDRQEVIYRDAERTTAFFENFGTGQRADGLAGAFVGLDE